MFFFESTLAFYYPTYTIMVVLQPAPVPQHVKVHGDTTLLNPNFADLIPEWFQPSVEEWRDIATGQGLFSTFSERTKTAVIIVYFHFRFQRSSGDSAYSDFIYSAQAKDETVEDWGIRLDMLVETCQKFGKHIFWEEYVNQWLTGTKTKFFVSALEEATLPKDPRTPPMVTDYYSFKMWYEHYRVRGMHKQRTLDKRSRLLKMVEHINSAKKSQVKATPTSKGKANPKPAPSPSKTSGTSATDARRTGPAPSVTIMNNSVTVGRSQEHEGMGS